MTSPDTPLAPILDPFEAVAAWERIYADRDDADELDVLCRRLAVGMVLSAGVKTAVEAGPAAGRGPVRGFLTQAARLSERVRITPLRYLVEFDAAAAAFVARHPGVIPELLRDQGEVFEDDQPAGLTARLRNDPGQFLRKMKVIAPLLLEWAELDRRDTEAFLRFLHRPAVLEPLRKAASVRDGLGPVVEAFRRERGGPTPATPVSQTAVNDVVSPSEGPSDGRRAPPAVTRTVIDNILWQVAVAVVQRHPATREAEARRLDEVRGRAARHPATLSARARYQLAFAEVGAADPAFARDLQARVQAEYDTLS